MSELLNLQSKTELKNHWFKCGTSSVVGKADEDSFANYLHNDNNAAFGVFDGHGGKHASSICSKSFCTTVLETADKMNAKETLDPDDRDTNDAILCESARLASDKIDREIKRQGKSGTTATTVFARLEYSGRIRLWCVNIGDSRSILVCGGEVYFLSEDHKLELQREVDRIVHQKLPTWHPLPKEPLRLSTIKSMHDSLDDSLHLDTAVILTDIYPNAQRCQSARELISRLSAEDITPKLDFGPSLKPCRQSMDDLSSLSSDLSETNSLFRQPASSPKNSELMDNLVSDIHDSHKPLITSHPHHSNAVYDISSVPPDQPNIGASQDEFDCIESEIVQPLLTRRQELGIVDLLMKELYRVYESERIHFWVPDNGKDGVAKLRCVLSKDLMGAEMDVTEGLVGACFTNKTLIHSKDSQSDSRRCGRFDSMTVLANHVICVPLKTTSGETRGVLELVNKTNGDRYTSEDVFQLRAMCEQTSNVLQAMRERGAHELGAENDEIKAQDEPISNIKGDNQSCALMYKSSFIARRTLGAGGGGWGGGPEAEMVVGPKALFSRYNISITMTRSLGDKFAARSCICMPEISAVDIAPQEFARCILASDGMWDVITPQEAAELVKREVDPHKAATLLAKRARRLREDAGIKIDDITVTVVDLNHESPLREVHPAAAAGCDCGCVIA